MRIQNWSKVGAACDRRGRRAVGLHDARPLYARGASRRARSARPSSERRRAPPWASSRAIARWSARSARSSARASAPWPAPASAPTWTARRPSCVRSSSAPASASRAIGDNITLNMPGNITFATNSADLNANFYEVLNSVSMVLDEFDQTVIEVAGHTDSTGADAYNQQLSERRARVRGGLPRHAQRAAGPHHHGRRGRGPAGRDERHGCRAPAEPPRGAHARPADAGNLVRRKTAKGAPFARCALLFRAIRSRRVRPRRAAS